MPDTDGNTHTPSYAQCPSRRGLLHKGTANAQINTVSANPMM